MARVRMSKDGLIIAKEGFNVDTATPDQLIFSTNSPTLRLYQTGTTTLAPYSGPLSDRFYRSIVYYDRVFPVSPLVLVAGVINNNLTDQSNVIRGSILGTNTRWINHSVGSFNNRFELYGYAKGVDGSILSRRTNTYRYFVFHNTMDDS